MEKEHCLGVQLIKVVFPYFLLTVQKLAQGMDATKALYCIERCLLMTSTQDMVADKFFPLSKSLISDLCDIPDFSFYNVYGYDRTDTTPEKSNLQEL